MNLKMLGNDAAHVELKDFDKIEYEELDVAIELIQEILNSWFRHQHLNAKLERLKKTREQDGAP